MNPRADRGCLFSSRRLTANLDGVPNEGLTPVAPVFLICLEIWIFCCVSRQIRRDFGQQAGSRSALG